MKKNLLIPQDFSRAFLGWWFNPFLGVNTGKKCQKLSMTGETKQNETKQQQQQKAC